MNNTQPNQSSAPAIDKKTLKTLEQAASQGHAEAQHQLGMIYANGQGVELDYKVAVKWQQKAAVQKHPQAMRTLAWLYANGYGTEQSDEKAQQLCLELAQAGDAKDQYFLASLYQTGIYGVKPDSKAMIHWYFQAAQQQYGRAQYALAKIILKGTDIAPNDEMAFQWLSLATINGHDKAAEELQKLTDRIPADILAGYKQRMTESIQAMIGNN